MQARGLMYRALLLIGGLVSAPLFAASQPQSPSPTEPGVAAIQGYSPVSYFTEGRAERGDPGFAVRHDGRTWFLASEEQQRLFEADPESYLPRYAQACPYNLALGRVEPINPTRFRIVAGQLLLFHSSEMGDGLELWMQSPLSEEELMRRADGHYELLRF